jgi:hypothetical protein
MRKRCGKALIQTAHKPTFPRKKSIIWIGLSLLAIMRKPKVEISSMLLMHPMKLSSGSAGNITVGHKVEQTDRKVPPITVASRMKETLGVPRSIEKLKSLCSSLVFRSLRMLDASFLDLRAMHSEGVPLVLQ